jgi:tetratricopeptide (TPR) repeat protein
VFGADHPIVMTTTVALAACCRERGQHAEAEALLTRALSAQEAILGPDDPAVAATLLELAGLHRVQWRLAEALGECERALAISEAALGEEDELVLQSLRSMERVYLHNGNYSAADRIRSRLDRLERPTERIGEPAR